MDFYQIRQRSVKNGVIEIYPDFKVCRSKDLMVRGKSFYGIWDEELGMWSTDEYDVPRIVDNDLYNYAKSLDTTNHIVVKALSDFSSKSWLDFRNYMTHVSDSSHQLDENIIFSNTNVTKKDYASRRLNYPLEQGDISAYDELIGTLYNETERAKIEWSIGAIISGDSKNIQKFIVLYGEAGAGKSTVLNIIQKLFEGYYTTFEAKALTTSNNAFSTEVFKSNPLVAIQHDGDLSRIEDNTKLNSIVSHEEIIINEKYKSSYASRVNCFLYMATNRPVKITDAKSGIIRRLIDVRPSGNKVSPRRYQELISKIDFELGAIAYHCLQVYKKMGKNYYSGYRPVDMMYKTDPFFNYVEDCFDIFKENDGTTLKAAYSLYKQYCDETNADRKLQMYKFREELKNYFREFQDVIRIDDKFVRSYYKGFITEKFDRVSKNTEEVNETIDFDMSCTESIFDKICSNCPAQYATAKETPSKKWDDVTTTLSDIDTKKLHYVKVPENHIVIDFDIRDENGRKSLEKNIEAASKWPSTYAEYSKSGSGIHLHYLYSGGNPSDLSRLFADNIEVKVFTGNSSLRRKLVKCNNKPIATINSGLPLKLKGVKMVNSEAVKTEKGLRKLIIRNMNKEIHPATKPSIDFIYKILDDAYNEGFKYDVTDMLSDLYSFAAASSHQSDYCLKIVDKMKLKSEDVLEELPDVISDEEDTRPIVFYDIEVFPNLLLINWKKEGPNCNVVRMINPSPQDVEELMKMKLVGFNCRRYDNHIIYARMMGYTNEELYRLSQRIIAGDKDAFFGNAYNVSYTDVYDFSAKKQSLKKFEIELGIHHQELGLPWDEPVPENMWVKVAEYCDNDVIATEATFNARKADFEARKVLAKIAGGTVNDTTNSLTTKLIFGDNRKPQDEFVYTELHHDFPGYKFESGKSTYRGEEVGEGGYVFANPGIHYNVKTFDVASMHPHSAIALNLFGDKYTQRFKDLVNARIAIKHKDIETLKTIFDGAFAEFINASDDELKNLASALKIAINSVYGLTAAKFANPFRDPRNIDNIVAKRGALFMIDLKHKVEEMNGKVVHIKTDSIKIEDPSPELEAFIIEYGKKWGYEFEVESEYERMCLVNDAVYIAKEQNGEWTATGTQFAVPYVFKTLFSHEPIVFEDMCETKSVSSTLYLDYNESLKDVSDLEKEVAVREYNKHLDYNLGRVKQKENPKFADIPTESLINKISEGHNYRFVGKVGSFCPIKAGCNGALLMREKDGKYYAVTGTKGYRWLESEKVRCLNKEDDIDRTYYQMLVDNAVETISQYGNVDEFIV